MNGGPVYNQIMYGMMPQQAAQSYANPAMQMPMTPMQKMNLVMQAMQNPIAVVRQRFPDIPDSIANDPNQIFQYLQRTRNISNEQLNQMTNQIPRY